MNKKIKKVAIAILLAIALLASSLTVVAGSTVDFEGDVTILWKESFPGSSWMDTVQTGDLDGDKKDDLILFVHNPDTRIQTVIAKRGIDGTHLWEESITGDAWMDIKVLGSDVSKDHRYGDLDGDRLPDVMVVINNKDTNTRTVIAKRGIDGTNLWEKSVTGNEWVTVEFMDDINHDRLTDTVVIVNDWSAGTYTISARKGSNGATLWEESGSGNVQTSGMSDLNGDKHADLLLSIYNWAEGTYTAVAKRGCDGTDLWQESVIEGTWLDWMETRSVKDLNGDRIDDVLMTVHNSTTNTHTIIARKGSDGTSLWQESVSGTDAWLYPTPIDDLNGDRTADVLVTTGNWKTGDYTVIAKKGRDGTNLWKESGTGGNWIETISANDLNGDKIDDVMVTIHNDGANTHTVIARRGNDGTSLWQESVTGDAWIYAVPTGDLNGDRTADVLITTSNWGTGTFTVAARKGSDGTSLWEASSNSKIWGATIGDLDRDKRENALVITYDALYAVGTPKFGKFRLIYN
ncbi:hypothetical protein ANME2D_02036 [Candidatus Methanoperedens nitroreducens]|uniref:FG-GAP repeat protein n=1 Tax=Candidatus Methanoperedens nitratireducens TaxID=1392998 RepID=A0A062V8A2_9EURY|nr:VCBS repeat-containing protein [Candidatus Methanoperedens nitroreducens]KCZ71979.1 hypothetical protein ANME2D_02036 [Candidatus Methanoperedens nitroreducens]MDJ1422044.1 VCBS repeat-containing protein [Candidatus Methanoperedens sp.]